MPFHALRAGVEQDRHQHCGDDRYEESDQLLERKEQQNQRRDQQHGAEGDPLDSPVIDQSAPNGQKGRDLMSRPF
jgi:hypothetical protein